MREIKFRAWDKFTQKYWNIENWHFEDEYLDLIESGVSIADPNSERVWRKFNEVKLMQYTGLKDKNGREIYEGDIVRSIPRRQREKSFVGDVRYGQVDSSFTVHDKDGNDFRLYSSWEYRTYEVIGNIYENPELLEEEK